MSKTTITHPDGSVTTVQSQSGCGQGCAWTFWIVLGVFVVAFPALTLPMWGAVLACILEGVIALAAIASWAQRRKMRRPSG